MSGKDLQIQWNIKILLENTCQTGKQNNAGGLFCITHKDDDNHAHFLPNKNLIIAIVFL